MVIDLNKVFLKDYQELNQDFTFPSDYQNKDILELKDLHVKGIIKLNDINNIIIDLELTGVMVLKDSITLENINHSFSLNINEEMLIKLNVVFNILWENIVLEVPISLTIHQDVEMVGDGWSFGTNKKNNDIDPRLAKLQELLDNGKE